MSTFAETANAIAFDLNLGSYAKFKGRLGGDDRTFVDECESVFGAVNECIEILVMLAAMTYISENPGTTPLQGIRWAKENWRRYAP